MVVDNSSAWRMHDDVPLVVAGVNDHAAADHEGIIANPNCTTMVLMMAIAPLHRAAGLEGLIATSYQSVSGTGKDAMDALVAEIAGARAGPRRRSGPGNWSDPGLSVYSRPIAWNVLPLAGSITTEGYTDEEWKLVHETRKILEAPDIRVEPACVRVPVMVGHGIAATAWFGRDDGCRRSGAASSVPHRDPRCGSTRSRHPLDSAGIDDVLVGRIRRTVGTPGGISLWAVGDNLRKGAALNAVQVAELLV